METLWYTRCPVPTPLGLAARSGWLEPAFKPLGFEVRSVIDSPLRAVRESHFSHHLPGSFRQGGNIPALWARASGADTLLLGVSWTDEFQATITLPGRGITRAADLRGRRVALPLRAGELVDFHRATALKGIWSSLATAGLDLRDAELVDVPLDDGGIPTPGDPRLHGLRRRLPYFQEVAWLLEGRVDAIFVKGPEGIHVANFIGADIVCETGHHADARLRINNGTPRPLTVDRGLLQRRPDAVDALVTLVRRAGEWAAGQPEATRRFVALEAGSPEDAVLASAGSALHEQMRLDLAPDKRAALSFFARFLFERGYLPQDIDVEAWAAA